MVNRRCAVLGSPVAHSLSPVLHRAAYRELGLAWHYDAVDVTEDQLPGFIARLDPAWRGLSLTMPLKRAILPLLDDVSATVTAAGAANTVVLDGGRRRGDNTDVPGMQQALAERGTTTVRTAAVLGGGATATSAVLALAGLGCGEVTVFVRSAARARGVVEAAERLPSPPALRVRRIDDPGQLGDLGRRPVDVVVSTIPAAAQPGLTPQVVGGARVVFDVVYDPWPTPLAAAAEAAGVSVVGGLDLLLHQATLQVELMTGCARAPLAAMRTAGEAALRARGVAPA